MGCTYDNRSKEQFEEEEEEAEVNQQSTTSS